MSTDTSRRRVTAADVARSLGVSRATVGFVLNDTPGQTISEATRARVVAEAARLGYRPHTAAQALASGRSHLILLVLPDWPMEYSMRRNIEEASLVLEEAGYSLVTYTPHESSRVRPLWESLNPDVVMGMLPFSDDDVESLHASGVSRIVPDPDNAAAWEKGASITTGPSLQVRHLHDLGHRRIAFAAPVDVRLSGLTEARHRAAHEAATALGMDEVDRRSVDPSDGSAAEAITAWVQAGVTGVVAYNDDVAAVVVGAALRAGIDVPGQLAVVGHDDSPLAAIFVPSLSSVHQDDIGLGRQLAAVALNAADGRPLPQGDPALTATLIRREST